MEWLVDCFVPKMERTGSTSNFVLADLISIIARWGYMHFFDDDL
jgi:hypothetical protein